MLPIIINDEIEVIEQTSHTFHLNMDENTVFGFADGQEAMKQAIYLILFIERYQHVILPWSYGIETLDLFGMPISWIIPEVKRRIQEALLQDTRIQTVNNFTFNVNRTSLSVTFTVHTLYGDINTDWTVNI